MKTSPLAPVAKATEFCLTFPHLYIPLLGAGAFSIVLIVIHEALLATPAGYQGPARIGLFLVAALVWAFCINWLFTMVSHTVKTRKIAVWKLFDSALIHLGNFSIMTMAMFVLISILSLGIRYFSTVNDFTTGIATVVSIVILAGIALKWGLAPVAIYYDNATLKNAFIYSNNILNTHRMHYITIIGVVIAAGIILAGFLITTSLLVGNLLTLLLATAVIAVYFTWAAVVKTTTYRQYKLKH